MIASNNNILKYSFPDEAERLEIKRDITSISNLSKRFWQL